MSLLIVTLLYKKYFVSPNKFNVHRQLLTNWTSFVSNDLDFELFSMIGIRRIRILIVNIIRKIAIYHKKLQKAPYGSWTIKYTMLSWTLFFFWCANQEFLSEWNYGSQKDPELSRKYLAQIFLQELTTWNNIIMYLMLTNVGCI